MQTFEADLIQWLSLFGRWLHLVTGVAWIGASFYFVFLDNSLLPPAARQDAAKGVGGELWALHGGGFYHAQKYRGAPPQLPTPLHWFKWEAYSTWLSGMFLLGLIYWYGAELYLIDTAVMDLSKPHAIGISVAFLVGGWLVYDQLCRSRWGQREWPLAVVLGVLIAAMAFALCHIYSGRGAYMIFGAVLGSIMVANVFFVIIPAQKELVAAKRAGRAPAAALGLKAKQRSVHNTYFTLPVLFVMVSNHYSITYAHTYNWLVLLVLSLAGALLRVYFVARHAQALPDAPRRPRAYLPLALGGGLLVGLVVAMLVHAVLHKPRAARGKVTFAQVQAVIAARCTTCHSAQPSQFGYTAPPAGVRYDTPAEIRAQAEQIHRQAVVDKVMPLANLTAMTDAERALLEAWFRQR